MTDSLKLIQDALKLAQEAQKTQGLSDTVLLAIIAGLVTIATLIINGRIEAKAKQAEAIAALEAAKVNAKLAEVEIKIDGRLTQLLEISKKEAEERGHRLGKEQAKSEEVIKETPVIPGPTKLKIIEGEIRVTPSTEKKKP